MAQPLASVLDEIFSILKLRHIELSAPFRGWSHDVFVLKSNAGQQWSLRIAKNEFAASLAECSLVILRHIAQVQPTLAIPAIVHVGKGYSILQYLEGVPLNSWMCSKPSLSQRHQLLDGVATFLYQLWTCTTNSLELGILGAYKLFNFLLIISRRYCNHDVPRVAHWRSRQSYPPCQSEAGMGPPSPFPQTSR